MGGCSHQGQGSACGLLSSTIQCWSFPTVQNDLFKTTGDEWVLLNLNVTGYYLVNYDQNNWKKIHTQLQTDLSVGVCPPPPPPNCPPTRPGPRMVHQTAGPAPTTNLRSHPLLPLLGHPCHQPGSGHP